MPVNVHVANQNAAILLKETVYWSATVLTVASEFLLHLDVG